MKGEKGPGLLNLLEVISARREGDCNRVGEGGTVVALLCDQKQLLAITAGIPVEHRVLYAHPSSRMLWAVVPGTHAQLSAKGLGMMNGWLLLC